MNKIKQRIIAGIAGVGLATGIVASTATPAAANPPKLRQCLAYHTDGWLNKNHYYLWSQNAYFCVYEKYTRYSTGRWVDRGTVVIEKVR